MPQHWFRASRLLMWLRRVVRNDQLILTFLALVVGAAGGFAVVVFRDAIVFVQTAFYGSGTEHLFKYVETLPAWRVVAAPTVGGLVVGLLICYMLPGRRPVGVADVIEASALRGGHMSSAIGLRGAAVNVLSIGVGASVGREGPAVHLGAALASAIARRLRLTRTLARTLLGCGVATAVAASFNAPIAGALFASEVIVGHYALRSFAPIVIASVTGTAISRASFGDYPAFTISEHAIASYWELPAYALLGLIAGVAAMALMKGIFLAQDAAARTRLPDWAKPAVAGFMVGLMALVIPQVLGVGYGATEFALIVAFPLWLLLAVGLAKMVATSICIGFGFGGGIFSPALVIGAMVGGAYGIVVSWIMPDISAGPGGYTIVGMGAMAAAVLGAPISTTLIIFEMTGNYPLTLGVMVAVVLASVLTRQLYGQTFFTAQLARRGHHVKGGHESGLLRSLKVLDIVSHESELVTLDVALPELRTMLTGSRSGELFVVRENGALFGTITLADMSEVAFDPEFDDLIKAGDVARMHPPVLLASDTLETALTLMRDADEEHIAVVEDAESMTFVGCVHERDVMDAYNQALLKVRREEHG